MRILDAALKVFSEKGYAPAVLDDVAREADVAKGTLYLYFRNKEELFTSTIMFVIEKLAERIRSNVRETADPFDALELIAYHQLDFFSGNRDFFCVFHNLFQENLLKKHKRLVENIHKRTDEIIEHIFCVVELGKKTGRIRSDIPTEDMVYSFGGMVMNMIRVMFNPDSGAVRFDAAQKARSITSIFLEGVASKKRQAAD